jgi:hypothetical protein
MKISSLLKCGLPLLCFFAFAIPAQSEAQDQGDPCLYLYTDWDYGGDEYIVGPNSYAHSLSSQYNDQFSGYWASAGCYCVLYEHNDYKGRSLVVNALSDNQAVPRIPANFNDIVSSFYCQRRYN